jgi:type VI secretion system secreted protein VgrG
MEQLDAAAAQQTALCGSRAISAQEAFITALDVAEEGRHPGTVNGQAALRTLPNSREADPAAPVGCFARPAVVLDAAAGLHWSSPASASVFAGQALQWTSQGDWHASAGQTISGVAGEAGSLFAAEGGIRAVAAKGPVSLAAHTDALALLADGPVQVTSAEDGIEVAAQGKIVLTAGGAAVTLEGGNITFACPGTFSVKGATHGFGGGASAAAALEKLPDTRVPLFEEQFQALDQTSGKPLTNMPYRIVLGDGTTLHGYTDAEGKTQRVATADPQKLQLFWDAQPPSEAALDDQAEGC